MFQYILIRNFKRINLNKFINTENINIMENIQFHISSYEDELQILIDGKKSGYMSIEVDGRLLIVYYTKLDKELEGNGYAKMLLDELVRYAEEKDMLIDPECDFVRQQFENHPARYKNIWHA